MADPAAIRFNNPGAMWPGPSSKLFGATSYTTLNDGQNNRIAQFPDAESGAAAQFDLLKRGYAGMTLADAIKKWSGGNHYLPYADYVSKNAGIPMNAVLTPEYLSDPAKAIPVAKAMAAWEAGKRDQAGRLLPYPMADDQWNSAHKRFLGGPQTASTATPQNYDMYGETVKPSPAPITTGSIQGRQMPQDPVTGAWTPEEVIKSRYGTANQFWDTRKASTPIGAIAEGLGGFFGMREKGAADDLVRQNQNLRNQAVQGMAGETDSGALGRRLLGTGIPGLQEQGMQLIAHDAQKKADLQSQFEIQKQRFEYERKLAMDLERQKREENMKMFDRFFGGGLTGQQPQPAAPSVAPQAMPNAMPSAPSGVPGISLGQAPTPQAGHGPMASPMPTAGAAPRQRSEGMFDKRRLGMAVAAGIISPEAAKLMAESNKFDDAYDAEAGKDFAGAYKGYREGLSKANSMLGSYEILERLIKNPATIQGMGAGTRKTFDRTMELMGIKTEGLAPTQVMEALANEMTLQMRSAAGGMPGAMSDKDLGFLQAMVANTANSPEANLFLVQMRKRVLEREQTVAKMALRFAQNNGGRIDHRFDAYLQDWAEKNQLWSDAEMKGLMGQKDSVVKASPETASATQAPAKTWTPQELADAPIGTVANGSEKVGPGKWRLLDSQTQAPQAAPQPQRPKPEGTPAERAARAREENARATADAPRVEAEKTARVKAEFDADAQSLSPAELVQKYDGLRWYLGSSRILALEDAMQKAMGR